MQEEEEDEEIDELWDWIDSQPWTEEDYERVREMEKRGSLTEKEREWCRKWCCGDDDNK